MSKKKAMFFHKYGAGLLENLVAYYAFENNSNDLVNGYNGVDTGVTYISGKHNQAIQFTAQYQYVTIADNDDFSFTDGITDLPFSINTWIYITGYSSSGNRFLTKRSGSGSEWIYIITSTALAFICYNGGSSSIANQFAYTHSFSLNTWYMITTTYDGNNFKFYINGVDIGVTSVKNPSYTKMLNTSVNTRIGNQFGQTNSNHLGMIDELAIWKNRQLIDSEVVELYNGSLGKFYPF